MSICHAAPDNPARGNGLTLKRFGSKVKRSKALAQVFGEQPPTGGAQRPASPRQLLLPSPAPSQQTFPDMQTTKSTKRASSISILSGLGVRDPEKALDPPSSSPSQATVPTPPSKKPSKLRNFFGQRPPSELITNHLTEYFPFTEKKVLERTARHSIMRTSGISGTGNRDSAISWSASRLSTSTQSSVPRNSISPSRPSTSAQRSGSSSPPREAYAPSAGEERKPQGELRLHETLSEACFANDQPAVVILYGARNNFGSRGALSVDQHD